MRLLHRLSLRTGLVVCSTLAALLAVEGGFRYYEPIPEPVGASFTFPNPGDPDSFLVVVLGGSTAAGEPYDRQPPLSAGDLFVHYLRQQLPQQNFRILKTFLYGGDLRRVLIQSLAGLPEQPDLLIVIAGHNEFLGRYGPNVTCKNTDSRIAPPTWRRSATLRFLQERLRQKRLADPPRRTGRELFDRPIVCSYQWHETLVQYDRTIGDIARLSERLEIPTLFAFPAGNSRDFEPNRSVYRGDPQHREIFEQLYRWGRHHLGRSDFDAALACFAAAETIDSSFADLLFRTGQALSAKDREPQASDYFRRASDNDGYPFRALSEQSTSMRRRAEQHGHMFVDFRRVLREGAGTGALDHRTLADMHHPNLTGYFLMARAIYAKVAQAKLIPGIHPRDLDALPSDMQVLETLGFGEQELFHAILSRVHWLDRIRYYGHASVERMAMLLMYHKILNELRTTLRAAEGTLPDTPTHEAAQLRALLEQWSWPRTSPEERALLLERGCRTSSRPAQERPDTPIWTPLDEESVMSSLNPWHGDVSPQL